MAGGPHPGRASVHSIGSGRIPLVGMPPRAALCEVFSLDPRLQRLYLEDSKALGVPCARLCARCSEPHSVPPVTL